MICDLIWKIDLKMTFTIDFYQTMDLNLFELKLFLHIIRDFVTISFIKCLEKNLNI